MDIQKVGDVARKAFKEIKEYQDGTKKIIKTDRPYIDNIGIGLINKSVILLAGGSGVGKSHELSRLRNNVMNEELNPDAYDYVFLNVSLEMSLLSLILRDLEQDLSKDKKEILLEYFEEDEKKMVDDYYRIQKDGRMYISQVPTSVEEFYNGCRDFLKQNKDKATVFISIDHIVLITSSKNTNKNQVVEALIEKINNLKMEFSNVIFILLSQTNSNNQKRAGDKDRMAQPRDSDIYYSQFSYQIADYVCVLQAPYKMGIKSYSKLYPKKYQHLEDYFVDEDSKKRISLRSEGMIYYHVLKCREGGSNFTDIFAEEVYKPEKKEEKSRSVMDDLNFEGKSPENAFENKNSSDDTPF